MSVLKFNNKFIGRINSLIGINNGDSPPLPATFGYWVHKDSGVITEFDSTDSSITGTTFNAPSWKNNASEIRLPTGITTISNNALAESPDLVTLILPSSVNTVGNNILSNTPSFEHLHSYAPTAPTLTSLGVNVGDYRLQIKVNASSYDSYRLASGWSQYDLKLFVLNDLIPGSRVHSGYNHSASQVTLNGQSNVVIEGYIFDENTVISNSSYGAITLFNCSNIIIRNCKFINLTPVKAISIQGSSDISIYNCDIIDCHWAIVGHQNPGSIRIFSNDFKNIKGHLLGSTNCQAIQTINSSGGDTRIQDNAIENIIDQSAPEDVININGSFYPEESPCIIRNNYLRGGGPSGSSGGIILGDGGGSNQIMEYNVLVNPGQYGIQIAGGANQVLRGNKVFGEALPWSNVGVVVVDWTPNITPTGNYTAEYNRVFWRNRDNILNAAWIPSDIPTPHGAETNTLNDVSITAAILPAQIIGIEPSLPPDPGIESGYWVHKDSKMVTEFGMTDSNITGTTFNTPTWKNDAEEIRLPDGVTTIASNALANSPDLVTLILPASITSMGSNILSNTPKFENLYSYALTAPSLTSLGSSVGDYRLQIKVEADSFDSYRLASGWSQYYLKLFVLNGLIPGSRVHNGYTVQTTPTVLNNPQNVVIENICFDSDHYLEDTSLLIWGGQNVIIRNCKFRGKSKARAIHIDGATNVAIYNCVFENVYMGARITLCHGGIRSFSNDYINIRAGFDGGFTAGGACQLTYNQGGDYRVQDSIYEGIKGESSIEDVYNLYSCPFDDDSPLINRNNWIRNGGPGDTSGGALIGDDDGVVKSKRAIIENNIFVNPGQYGVSLAGGDYGILRNNKVYGAQRPWTNVGLIAVNWAGDGSVGNVVANNQVKWTGRNGNDSPYWVHESAGVLEGWETNDFNPPIDESILPVKIATLFPGEDNLSLKGWYENTSFGKELITTTSSFISGGVMSRPSWYTTAVRVWVPEGVTELNASFNGASNLKEVTLPSGLFSIEANTFNGTALEELKIPSTVTFIGNNNLNIKGLIFHSATPPTIGSTQNMNNVEYIEVPDDSVSSYISVFTPFGKQGLVRPRNFDNGYVITTSNQTAVLDREHDLMWGDIMVATDPNNRVFKELKVPGGTKHLVTNFMLQQVDLEKVILPEGLQSIGAAAFRNCTSLTEINIPEGIKTIAQVLLQECNSLRNITIPASVDFIGSNAFAGEGEMTIRFLSAVPPKVENPNMHFLSTLTGKTIKVPPASVNAYKAAQTFIEYESIIVADDGL